MSSVINKSDDSDPGEEVSVGRKVPIVLREPGGSVEFESEEEYQEDEEDVLRNSQLVLSNKGGFN